MVKERYTVDSVVCDYGIFENGELIEKLIFNSSTNAKLVCKIMNLDADHKIIGKIEKEYECIWGASTIGDEQ